MQQRLLCSHQHLLLWATLALSCCTTLSTACAAHWQARHLLQHARHSWSHASATQQHGRALTAVEPQPGFMEKRGGIRQPYLGRSSVAPAPFTITSVSLSLSITGQKVTVTNHMELQPYNSTSCRPAPAPTPTAASSGSGSRVSKLVGSGSSSSRVCEQHLDLDAREMKILGIWLDGEPLGPGRYNTDKPNSLTIVGVPARPFSLKLISTMQPPADPVIQTGLFIRNGYYLTSFEPYGMSRITPYLDRPDIQPLWTVRMEADALQLPVLLSNGKLVEAGKLPKGRHYVVWKDPRPHPSYQTALVAGKLSLLSDSYTSCLTGRCVALRVYAPAQHIKGTSFALYIAKAALAWFETAWGLPYREDSYTMVGIPGVKGDAGEVSQMAVFNVNFLSLTPETRTDADAEESIRLVGHELFHMWSGNYVTVNSWFDLVAKEGLTTFMEQAFAADLDTAEAAAMGLIKPPPPFKAPSCTAAVNATAAAAATASEAAAPRGFLPLQQLLPVLRGVAACRGGKGTCGAGVTDIEAAPYAWRRIADVAYLRRNQVPEDDGEYSHPLRLTNVSKVAYPYTNTMYRKGAEAVRMYRLMLGPAAFSKGLQTWVNKYFGKAASVEDFQKAMSAASPGALPPNWLSWYDQPGTPWVWVDPEYDSKTKTLKLQLDQGNAVVEDEDGYPGVTYTHLPIPIKLGLLSEEGASLPLKLKGRPPFSRVLTSEGSQTAQVLLNGKSDTITLLNVPDRPVISLLRSFSAPVRASVEEQSPDDLAVIASHDRDAFARYNAANRLLSRLTLVQLYRAAEEAGVTPATADDGLGDVYEAAGGVEGVPDALIDAYRNLLSKEQPGGTKGFALSVPSVQDLEVTLDKPEPVLLVKIRAHVCKVLAQELKSELQQVAKQADARAAQSPASGFSGPAMSDRQAANAALNILACNWDAKLEQQLLQRSRTSKALTDQLAALQLLVNNAPQKTADAALQHFRQQHTGQPDALRQWLVVQGSSSRPGNAANIRRLLSSGAVDLRDNDAVAALLGSEGFMASAENFEAADGSGYKFLVDAILQVDKVDPSAASGLLWQLGDEYDNMPKGGRKLLKAELKRLRSSQVSKDLAETLAAVMPDA